VKCPKGRKRKGGRGFAGGEASFLFFWNELLRKKKGKKGKIRAPDRHFYYISSLMI